MASISRFDQPAQSQFINNYVPIPFQEMVQAGQIMQKQYEDRANTLDRLYEDTYNLEYIPDTEDENYIKNKVIPTVRNTIEKYSTMDLGDPMIYRQAIRDLNSSVDRNRINEIQKSAQGWKEDQKNIIKQKQEGKYADFLETPYKGYDTSVSGIYRGITPAALDYRKKMETYFDNLEPDSYVDKNSGQIIAYIDEKKIAKTAQGNLQSFVESPEGRQKTMELQSRGITGKDQEKELLEYAKQVGREHLMRKVQGFVPEYMTKDKDPDKPIFSNAGNTQSLANTDLLSIDKSNTAGVNLDKVKDITDIAKKFTLDKVGNITTDRSKYTYLDPFNEWKETENPKKKKEEEDKISSVKNIVRNIKQVNPDLLDKSDIQVLDAYAKARNNAKNVDYNTYLYDNSPASKDAKKLISDQVIDDMGGRLLLNASTGKSSGKPINTISDLFEDLDIPKEDRKKENLVITSIVPAKNAYKATIWATDGPHDFMISTNKREQSYLHLVEQATRAANNGVVGDKTIRVGEDEYIIRTKLVDTGDGNYTFSSGIATKDPNKTIPGTTVRGMNLNDLESVSMSNLINNLKR